ncbi:MAG: hypothetical protein NVS1B7_7580 [Candidatus Saccharimonadales bacterium]
MNNSPEQAPVAVMPNFVKVEQTFINYETARGTHVTQQRFYGSLQLEDGRTIKKQIRNKQAAEVFVNALTVTTNNDLEHSDNLLELEDHIDIVANASPEASPVSIPTRAAGELAVAASIETKGAFSRLKNRIFGERNNSHEHPRRRAALTVGALALTAGSFLGFLNHDGSTQFGKSASAEETTTTKPNNTTVTTLKSTTSTTSGPEVVKIDAEVQARIDANNNKITEIGLHQGQFVEVQDEHAVFTDAIEADGYSLNHGADAWTKGGYGRNTIGAKQMGAELTAGVRNFTKADAAVAQEAMRTVGNVPQQIIDQLAANNFDNMTVKVIAVNSPTYHDMTFNNNGQLAVETLRTGVGNDDHIMLIAYKNPTTGKHESFASRVDCSGFGQVFRSVSVPTPAVTPTPEVTTPTPKKETTVPNHDTTTVPKSTSTTTPKHETTTTIVRTTTTTIPQTTTTNSPTTTTPTTITTPTTGPNQKHDDGTQSGPNRTPGTTQPPVTGLPTPDHGQLNPVGGNNTPATHMTTPNTIMAPGVTVAPPTTDIQPITIHG